MRLLPFGGAYIFSGAAQASNQVIWSFSRRITKKRCSPERDCIGFEDRYVRISLLVQQGREGLVDQEAEDHIQHSLEEGEGHIEDGQALMRLSEEGRIA